ncbi:hypothetical protein [Streptomyces sp. NPDC047453]|uniref:hypothetical protein n=1 Tax=Streptomyces sp. NPDC047453 TaxID=3154812 RepID=UPI0033C37C83
MADGAQPLCTPAERLGRATLRDAYLALSQLQGHVQQPPFAHCSAASARAATVVTAAQGEVVDADHPRNLVVRHRQAP